MNYVHCEQIPAFRFDLYIIVVIGNESVKQNESKKGRKGSSKGVMSAVGLLFLVCYKTRMSRPLRIEFPGAWYHVMNRGRRRENIFLGPQDYEIFIKLLQETDESWNVKIAAYCLMSNHYHLLVHTPVGNLSRCMRHINGVYTQRFNRCHDHDGQLFRGRYKAVLIDADSHLLEVVRYIHKNPLRAGICKDLQEYSYSSHHGYMSTAEKWAWLKKDMLLAMLGEKEIDQRAAYLDFVSRGEGEEITRFYSSRKLPSVLGSDSFKQWVKVKFKHLIHQGEVPRSRDLALTAEQIISLVCDHFQVKRETLAVSRRGTENLPRDVAIYLVRLHSRETLAAVGQHFAINKYSTVSSAVERIKARKDNDKILRRHLEQITRILDKNQDCPAFEEETGKMKKG